MPRNTKKAERAALQKQRKKIHRELRAKKRAKSSAKRATKTHPHRRTSAMR